jgi:hypothetical protein
VTAFLRVYQAEDGRRVPVTITTRIVDGANRSVHATTTQRFQDLNGKNRSADHLFALPLATLDPGQYLLTIEATRGPRQTARRDIMFAVR